MTRRVVVAAGIFSFAWRRHILLVEFQNNWRLTRAGVIGGVQKIRRHKKEWLVIWERSKRIGGFRLRS